MLLLNCPYCGVDCDETELQAGGEAHLKRELPGSAPEAFESYMFMRENPMGVVFERWRHVYGCGKWFHAARSSTTLEVYGTYSAQTSKPPKALVTKIQKKLPNWSGFEQ